MVWPYQTWLWRSWEKVIEKTCLSYVMVWTLLGRKPFMSHWCIQKLSLMDSVAIFSCLDLISNHVSAHGSNRGFQPMELQHFRWWAAACGEGFEQTCWHGYWSTWSWTPSWTGGALRYICFEHVWMLYDVIYMLMLCFYIHPSVLQDVEQQIAQTEPTPSEVEQTSSMQEARA